jgi:hypothetical protein
MSTRSQTEIVSAMNNGEEYPDLPEVKLIPPKERWAIARSVVLIFAFVIGGLFVLGFATLIASMWITHGNVDISVRLMKEAILPLMEEVAKFAATVFSPLLAFIFGFYFGSGRHH